MSAARFIPLSGPQKKSAIEPNDSDLLALQWPKSGTHWTVRPLPHFEDERLPFLRLVQHWWFGMSITCPELSNPVVVTPGLCPLCRALEGETPPDLQTLTCEFSYIVFALMRGKAGFEYTTGLVFPSRYWRDFRKLLLSGALDLKTGFWVALDFSRNSFTASKLAVDKVAPVEIKGAGYFLHYSQRTPNPARLANMAAAFQAQQKLGWTQPPYGQSVRLREFLPGCTLIPLPFGFKGPVAIGWQKTSFEMMKSKDYIERLELGNVGCLCGFDQAAYGKKLVPYGCVVGLDGDRDDFAAAVVRENPWLRKTFAVRGRRAQKWFFRLVADDLTEALQSRKIVDVNGAEAGDWLATAKQGVICGLHPEGLLYEITQPTPLLDIPASQFRMPPGFCFAGSTPKMEKPSRRSTSKKEESSTTRFRAVARMEKEEHGTRELLDLSRLENLHRAPKGLEARCPACHELKKDQAGDNLLIFPDGHYSCASLIGLIPQEKHAHNSRIFALAARRPNLDQL